MSIKNPRKTLEQRRELRQNMTKAEQILWEKLRAKRLIDVRVRRQFGIGPFILDFYIAKIKLAIEVDGKIHLTPTVREKDFNRSTFLIENGIKVIRFTNEQVIDDLENVLQEIKTIVEMELINLDETRE